MERAPGKRRIKPPANLESIDFDSDSSSDSDFNIEDHYVDSESGSGDSCFSLSDDDVNKKKNEKYDGNNKKIKKDDGNKKKTKKDNEEIEENNKCKDDSTTMDCTNGMMSHQDDSIKEIIKEIVDTIRICNICLGDESDRDNEIINCDECGISVHEGCYGICGSENLNSSTSSCSMKPWFCEPCKAGIENPTCEFCPNFGGIFKEADNGRWVHLVCALFEPNLTFGDVKNLSKPMLFGHGVPEWNKKNCILCEDYRLSSIGVTIRCDVRMCRLQFHVTCAQKEGGLSGPDQVTNQLEPFYAHCKMHENKLLAKRKNRNWQILQLITKQMELKRKQQSSEKSTIWQRNQQWLKRLQSKDDQMKDEENSKTEPIFKSKVSCAITTSTSSCQALWLKSDLMGINTISQEVIEEQIKELRNIPKKWNIPPAFSLEFVSYFKDRNLRSTKLKNQLKIFTDKKNQLFDEQKIVQEKYNQQVKKIEIKKQKYLELKNIIKAYHKVIKLYSPNANILDFDIFAKEVLNDHNSFDNILSDLYNKCSICSHTNDQHLLKKCDICRSYYHLGCLNPPLTKMPKKTKLFGWQCSNCENCFSHSKQQTVNTNTSKKLRCDGKEQSISGGHKSPSIGNNLQDFNSLARQCKIYSISKKKKKHEPNSKKYSSKIIAKQVKTLKRKHKYNNDDNTSDISTSADNPTQHGIKRFIKSIPSTSGVKTKSSKLLIESPVDQTPQKSTITKPEKSILPLRNSTVSIDILLTPKCNTCHKTGINATMVQCDKCSEHYHFCCINPPVKKTPKVFGYSWHCEECDLSDSD
ncbi:unnamed protein product [Aphis gossypii]|uniref:PHD finger protein 14 n=1 Tax=Aphis gossypii TaxID=80765 RepID=A0A9P0NQA8_APHGO|nr:unnamed protein product [Aphis gossypii]